MKYRVETRNEQNKVALSASDRALVRRAVKTALAAEKTDCPAEVSVTFTDDEGIRVLNRDYRGKDAPTDVLSFPLFEEGEDRGFDRDPLTGAVLLGDIVISAERAERQAAEFGHSVQRELAFLAIHSTLHLLGYDHERSEEDDLLQRRRQKEILALLSLSGEQDA
ncbi:MAG: rRNA maturation RNase YbeY [Clostridia bacterium]|nr:rRNA maturation RNase YbeY [Clostridia bacterium]